MKLYHLYDESTFEVIGATFFEEGKQPSNAFYIENYNFVKGVYNPATGEVTEAETPEKISIAKKAETIEFLDRMFAKVKLYIKAMAMGKSIHDDLAYYEEAYTNKYHLCLKLKDYLDKGGDNPDPFNTIDTEAQLEGMTTNDFISNVLLKFEQGKRFNDNGIQLIECLRKRIYADIELEAFDTAKARLELIDNLPATITPTDVATIYQQVMADFKTRKVIENNNSETINLS